MRIGVDCDEVLLKLIESYLEFNREKYGICLRREQVVSYHIWGVLDVSKQEADRRMDEFFESEFFERVSPVEDAQYSVSFLSKENNLLVITSRPLKIKNQTARSLKKFFGDVFSGIYHTDEYSKFRRRPDSIKKTRKVEVCKDRRVDVLIEDSLKNSIDCAEEGIVERVLLLDAPWNQNGSLPKNVKRV